MKKLLKNGFSLKWGLMTMMLACWVLPFVIILSVMNYYASDQARQRVQNTIVNSVESAVEVTKNGIKNAMDMMRSDTFESNIKRARDHYRATGDKTTFHQSVTENLRFQYSGNNNFITSMIYFPTDYDTIYYVGNHMNENALEHVNTYKEIMHPTIMAIEERLSDEVKFLAYDNTLYMIHALGETPGRPYAVLVMEVNISQLFRGLNSVVWLSSARVKIDNVRINAKGIGVKMPRDAIQMDEMLYAEDDHHVVRVQKGNQIENHNVLYMMAIDSTPLWDCFSALDRMFFPIVLAFIPLLLVAIWMFSSHISKPVQSMVTAAEEIQRGHIGYQIKEQPRTHEFNYLVQNFNNMSRNTKEQFERGYNEQVALQNERIKALQSQINPHFLHNTLEVINWEARKEDNASVCNMIEALGTMLSAAMLRNGKTKAELREEIEIMDAYLFIISVRMGSGLIVNMDIDPTLMDAIVPCMILQPVVENAIDHGIRPKQGGVLSVRIYKEGAMLIMEVENDGHFSDKHQANINRLLSWDGSDQGVTRASEVGIRNVNYRLKLLYGAQSGLTISRTNRDTTMAKIVLPCHKGQDSTISVKKRQSVQL